MSEKGSQGSSGKEQAQSQKSEEDLHVVFHKDDPVGYVMEKKEANRLVYGIGRDTDMFTLEKIPASEVYGNQGESSGSKNPKK